MYKLPDGQLDIYTLIHPLEDMLDAENRWVVRAKAMPWETLEARIAPKLYSTRGAPAKPLRMMLGAMIIGDFLRVSDAETVRQIQENPYLQFFIGLQEFTHEAVFAPLSLTLFRKRLTPEIEREIRQIMKAAETNKTEEEA
ncbi:MAG: transposase [Oscillospiraceae bacterium]|nr:transposase [Oscillospiraceae bacterium]